MKRHYFLEAIKKICDCRHLTVEEIFSELEKCDKVSLATVYRNVEELVERGELKKITGAGKSAYFESTKKPHAHLICKKSGKIQDLELPDLEASLPAKFKLKNLDLRFYGEFI